MFSGIEIKGNLIAYEVEELTRDVQNWSIKKKILATMIKYMILKLGKPLSRERRKELVEKYGKIFAILNFKEEYDRFVGALYKLGHFAGMNKIFDRFWKLYIKPYMLEIVEREDFKEEIKKELDYIDINNFFEGAFRDMDKLELYVYERIKNKLVDNLKEAYKDRYVLTVDVLSKVKEVSNQLREIDSHKTEIINIIKKRILEKYSLTNKEDFRDKPQEDYNDYEEFF